MLFIPALPNTKKTTLRNMVVHQTATLSKTTTSKLQLRNIVPQKQIVRSLGPSAVRRFRHLCHLVTTKVLIVSSLVRVAVRERRFLEIQVC